MFVRWKRNKLVSRRRGRVAPTGGVFLAAVLVRSDRVAGKPRQKVVAYLAGIQVRHVRFVLRRHRFWQAVDRRLESAGLTAGQRAKAEAAVAAEVPRPTPKEVATAGREWRTFAQGLATFARLRSAYKERGGE
jgi:hypothetical protein